MRTLPNAVELLANSSYSESKFSSITSGKLHDLDYNRTPRRSSIYFYIFGVWSLYDVQMSSKVNNKVPHTRINSIGTSFAQAQAKMTIVRRCLLHHFGSGRRKTGSRIETPGWIGTRPTPRPNIMTVTTAVSSCELEAKYCFYFNEVHRRW